MAIRCCSPTTTRRCLWSLQLRIPAPTACCYRRECAPVIAGVNNRFQPPWPNLGRTDLRNQLGAETPACGWRLCPDHLHAAARPESADILTEPATPSGRSAKPLWLATGATLLASPPCGPGVRVPGCQPHSDPVGQEKPHCDVLAGNVRRATPRAGRLSPAHHHCSRCTKAGLNRVRASLRSPGLPIATIATGITVAGTPSTLRMWWTRFSRGCTPSQQAP